MRDRRLISLSRSFRRRSTSSEAWLWDHLRGRKLAGLKFRRQVPIDRFVADFVCNESKVIVELDGSGHERHTEHDLQRKQVLESLGYLVLRFGSEIHVQDGDEVLAIILGVCQKRLDPS
ncbi:DUF559 domain-containing protein [bacterium]|nr:MAG: DUF559 domain-containing protein [bacterium]